jgi:hypothetical protein
MYTIREFLFENGRKDAIIEKINSYVPEVFGAEKVGYILWLIFCNDEEELICYMNNHKNDYDKIINLSGVCWQ